MSRGSHVLVNALSMGGGGGLTVGREISVGLAQIAPSSRITTLVVKGNPLHERLRSIALPTNCTLHWAPERTANIFARTLWERSELPDLIIESKVDVALQLNGMLNPNIRVPSICHMQDPWPYVPEAWGSTREKVIARLKRRAHARSLKRAAAVTWTSAYLRDLVCSYHAAWPLRNYVAYNGVPADWIVRATESLPEYHSRPMEIITVSNVASYKNHGLVIRAVKELLRNPHLADLRYRIVGSIDDHMRNSLVSQATELGIMDRIIIESFVSDRELANLYSRARCFVLMSICESFGIPAIEAMTFGTPVVTSDCCAMPEVCGNGAALVSPSDLGALVRGLERVLLDTEYANKLRAVAAARVQNFSWRNTSQRIYQTIEDVIR